MHYYALLALVPAALGCLNPKSNPCASYISANKATASAFCATFTQSSVTATTALPAWAANCSNKPSLISKECSCYFTGGGAAPTPTATSAGGSNPPVTTVAVPSGVTTTLPKSAGATATSKPITVPAGQVYDGGMKNFDRSRMLLALFPPTSRWTMTDKEQRGSARTRRRRAKMTPCSFSRTAPPSPTYVVGPYLLLHSRLTWCRSSLAPTKPRVSTARVLGKS